MGDLAVGISFGPVQLLSQGALKQLVDQWERLQNEDAREISQIKEPHYLTGAGSADSVREVLHEKGLRSETGMKISHSVLVSTLKNPFYAGLVVWKGKRKWAGMSR